MTGDAVTVVTGVPRSGTSLAMQMLAAGGMPLLVDEARPADADNPRGYFEFEGAKRILRDTSWLPRAVGRAVKVMHALVPALPDGYAYRVILVRRPLLKVVASQRAVLARFGSVQGGPSDAQLAAIFEAQLLALERWVGARPDAALYTLHYEAALAEPARAAAELARFLGGGLDEAAMAGAVDPALCHQRG